MKEKLTLLCATVEVSTRKGTIAKWISSIIQSLFYRRCEKLLLITFIIITHLHFFFIAFKSSLLTSFLSSKSKGYFTLNEARWANSECTQNNVNVSNYCMLVHYGYKSCMAFKVCVLVGIDCSCYGNRTFFPRSGEF